MATYTTVNGDISFSTGNTPTSAAVEFALTRWDTATGITFIPGTHDAKANVNPANGQFSISLWATDEGGRNATYLVRVREFYSGDEFTGSRHETHILGPITVPVAGPVNLADLLNSFTPPPEATLEDFLLELQAAVASAEAAAVEADAARDATAATAQYTYPDLPTLLAETANIAVGSIILTRAEGYSYEVMSGGSSDYDATTAGSVRIKVLPHAGRYETGAFGHVGSGANESARVQAALDRAASEGVQTVILSAPLAVGSTVLIPSRTALENPGGHVTTMLPGCRTAYSNRINDALVVPCQSPALIDPIIDGQNLSDAWHGVRWEGPYNPRIIRPRIYNFTATATGADGAGYLAADGGNAAYAGYDDATAIFMTTYKSTGGAFRRCAEWVIEHPEITNCCSGIIGTTHPDDSGSDGANFGLLTYPNIDDVSAWGVAWRFGEQNVCMHGRVNTPNESVKALFHVGDTVSTLINVGTDGIMFTSYVRLVEMQAGQSVTQISVAGVNILSAPVPFNTSLEQTVTDLLAAANAGPSSYTFARSARRPSLWIYASGGAKLATGTTSVTVTSNATKIVASGPSADTANIDYRGSGVTGLLDKNGFVEGHEGSDTIGILVTDQGSAEIINSGGNGPANRVWFAAAINDLSSGGDTAKNRTNHFRAADGMTYLGGGFRSAPLVKAASADRFTVAPLTPGDWSVAYTSQVFTRIPSGALDIVMAFLDFTPTFGTASGALRFNLPPELAVLISSGNQMYLNVEQIKTNTVPASVLGMPRFRLLTGATFGEVVWPKSDGTSSLWSVSHLTSGTNVQLRLFGHLPVDR